MAEIKIGVIGDSISSSENKEQGITYINLLASYLQADGYSVRMINDSFAASRTDSALLRLENMIQTDKPNILIITLGVADYVFNCPHRQIRDNLSATIKYALNEKIEVMLGIVDPFYLDGILNRGKDFYSLYFKEIFTGLAEAYPITAFPFFTFQIAGDPYYHLGDFIHPNLEGHKVIANTIRFKIKAILDRIQKNEMPSSASNSMDHLSNHRAINESAGLSRKSLIHYG
ncbi:GDSL-type esterase/lipase family protein [Candidatus Protochlamydia phocaeensis]|uniref:GDSL-type esterase/lipase family protein n=1 Tax=Candidatus Protochlamydia phocaeensis TaxID=1414722 RepID=UPI0008385650|nr:GDSL-type esterase/lipase family protein [Candidatus Protochlamydia phocaeensis]